MVAAQSAVGGTIRWGKWGTFLGDQTGGAILAYLNDGFTEWSAVGDDGVGRLHSVPVDGEAGLLDAWEAGAPPAAPEPRLVALDAECRLASLSPHVQPATLLLLQAALREPPASWKKHALPNLAKQVRAASAPASCSSF
jgi:hypothetical protein